MQDDISSLVAAITANLPGRFPVDIALWEISDIAAYLHRNEKVVGERIVTLPGFPQAIRLPTGNQGRGNPLWKAQEVIDWVEKYAAAQRCYQKGI